MAQAMFSESMPEVQKAMSAYYDAVTQLEACSASEPPVEAQEVIEPKESRMGMERTCLLIALSFVAVWLMIFFAGMLAPGLYWR